MIGVVMLVAFAAFALLMYARILPALLAVPLMALALGAIAGASPVELAAVVSGGAAKLAPVIVTVIFGALLSRVTLSTGIAETIVSEAAEFGGDRPIVLALVLSAAVAALFTSLTGLGAIIMVGSIVLPIMMTIGVPRRTAATLFLLSFALGFIFNIAQWKFYTATFGVEADAIRPFAFALAAIDALAIVAFVVVRFRATRGYATWALAADEPPRRRVAPYALVTPLLPIVLYLGFHIDPIVAFILASLYGVATTRPRDAIPTIVAAAIRGIEDVAPAIVLFMGIGMLLAATALPEVKAALTPVISAIAPRGALGYVVLFGLASPLALYRGPLNPFGVGIAVYTVLAGLGVLPAITLVAAIMAVVQVQNVCDATNTQNVWVANFTGVHVDEITKLTLPYQVAVATLGTLVVAMFGSALFGIAPFHVGTQASAATLPPAGMFAPPEAAWTIGVRGDGELGAVAADEVRRQIARGWTVLHATGVDGDPSATTCATKPYAAVATMRADPFRSASGTILDVGLILSDCAGWPVNEWHETGSVRTPPATDDVRNLALAALFRLRTWMTEHPELAKPLFERGLAYDAERSGPTYFYSLFKTTDGQMRTFVRTGGPAYDAGMRTNQIVIKIDGKFWWEYGTYQSQRRAYDGLPHTFVISDVVDGPQRSIALGAAYP